MNYGTPFTSCCWKYILQKRKKKNWLLYLFFVDAYVQVDLLKNKFGFDDAFNYKEEKDLNAALKRLVDELA